MRTQKPILLIEDNEDDAILMKRALKAADITNPLFIVDDGEKAIDYFERRGSYQDGDSYPIPSFVFIDLKLPHKSGLEVLAWIKSQESLKGVVTIVLTSSSNVSDLDAAYRLGVHSYLVKPPTTDQLKELAKAFDAYWVKFNRVPPLPSDGPSSPTVR